MRPQPQRAITNTKKKGRYMKIILSLIILQVIIYTWVHLYLSFKCGTEIAPSATIGFYSFCGVEAGVCGFIKSRKKVQYEEDFTETDEP